MYYLVGGAFVFTGVIWTASQSPLGQSSQFFFFFFIPNIFSLFFLFFFFFFLFSFYCFGLFLVNLFSPTCCCCCCCCCWWWWWCWWLLRGIIAFHFCVLPSFHLDFPVLLQMPPFAGRRILLHQDPLLSFPS